MAKIAVIKTGGKQYVVKENDKLKVEKLAVEAGASVELDALLIADGDQVKLGEPQLETKVKATVVRQTRTRKVTGVKYKRKTRQSKGFGHKQFQTEIQIEKI